MEVKMRSFSQLLEDYITKGDESLVRNITTPEDVEALFSKLEQLADEQGVINLGGVRTTIQRMREYIGKEKHDNPPVIKANRLYSTK